MITPSIHAPLPQPKIYEAIAIPHNLPRLQPFFGRQLELLRIKEALSQDSRTFGVVITGPAGIGKTALAVRAAYDASPEDFSRIIFVSLKTRSLDDDGIRDFSGFALRGLAELFGELCRGLGYDYIVRAPEKERSQLLLDTLRGTGTLLVIDSLENLTKSERNTVLVFVNKLPIGCKAILTSRARIGSGAQELILEGLSEETALAIFAKLAETSPALACTSEAERLALYSQVGGMPLLLVWAAGQIGRGHFRTLTDAVAFLRSTPAGSDQLEFIFGDLVENFSEADTRTLCALSYFALPAKVEHIAIVAGREETEIQRALKSLINRSLVVPSDELKTFSLVPLVADFLRTKKPELLHETGDRLEKYAYALVVENGYNNYDRFTVLDAAWPIVAAALPGFLAGENERLQTACDALVEFLNFTGRWDERLALLSDAESRAVAVRDFDKAGQRAYQAGWIHSLREESAEVLACADRAEEYWHTAQAGTRERTIVIRLRGIGHQLAKDYPAAVAAYREAVELDRSLGGETEDMAIVLNDLAAVEMLSGDLAAAERDYREALRIARTVEDSEGITIYTGNLAMLALNRQDWSSAETLARETLALSEKVGRLELIADNSSRLAKALVRLGKKEEALPYARRAVEIYHKLGSADLASAQQILAECEN